MIRSNGKGPLGATSLGTARSLGTATLVAMALASASIVAACGARTQLDVPPPPPAEPVPQCGNGLVDDGEECDDGNDANDDGCLVECVEAVCGDGVLARFEACEPSLDTTGTCRSDCTLPSCGDGIVDAGEECDPGSAGEAGCTPLCRLPVCGDGFVDPEREQCDAGADNADRYALAAIVSGQTFPIAPVDMGGRTIEAYWDRRSASSHTGLEAAETSRLFFAWNVGGPLHLLTMHGIDGDDDNAPPRPQGRVSQRFENLPAGASIALRDDKAEEFYVESEGTVVGDWRFDDNSDGGVLTGLPLPGSWSITVLADFEAGIERWEVIDADATDAPLALAADEPVFLVAQLESAPCRSDCSIPSCGDGIVDASEQCDDGNAVPNDGCSSACRNE